MQERHKDNDLGRSVFERLYKALGFSQDEAEQRADADSLLVLKNAGKFLLEDNDKEDLNEVLMDKQTPEDVVAFLSENFTDTQKQEEAVAEAMSASILGWVEEMNEGTELTSEQKAKVRSVLEELAKENPHG